MTERGLLSVDEIGEIAVAIYAMVHSVPLPVKPPAVYWDAARIASAMTGRFIAKHLLEQGELP